MNERSLSRRRLNDWLLRVGGVATLGSVLYPIFRYLSPLERGSGGGPAILTPEELARLQVDHFVITRVGTRKIMVLRDSAGTLRALDAKCTHEACIVKYLPGQSLILCGCHNGRFDLDGRVLAGPPPRPLQRHELKTDDQGRVEVTVRSS